MICFKRRLHYFVIAVDVHAVFFREEAMSGMPCVQTVAWQAYFFFGGIGIVSRAPNISIIFVICTIMMPPRWRIADARGNTVHNR